MNFIMYREMLINLDQVNYIETDCDVETIDLHMVNNHTIHLEFKDTESFDHYVELLENN